jgi:tripartite-type tricarboxylate transporter receptor subunit TctC
MKPPFKHLLVAAAFAVAAASALAADPYPSRPIRIIVNSAPGALLDVTTRVVAQRMSENLGQPVIVDDRPGADGLLGIRVVKGAPADGYTILATANTLAQLPALKLEPGYDIGKDFTGIGMMSLSPLIMVGAVNQQFKSLQDLITQAKARPGALTMASAGVGTSTHMAAALFMHQANVNMLHVPYMGNAAAMPDVVSGRVNVIFDGANSSGPQIREGRLRAFGVTSPKRMATYPEIPTLVEQGLPNYGFFVYLGLAAPAGTPRDVVRRLGQALQVALRSDAVRERFARDGSEAGAMGPQEFTEFLKQDYQRTAKVVTDLGLPRE